MTIIDGHCDVLYKLFEDPELDFYQSASGKLDVSFEYMTQSNVKIQFFAIYLPERITLPLFDHYLEYIRIFNERVLKRPGLRLIRTRDDLAEVLQGNERGALLTLEGADALRGSKLYLRTLFDLGVRMIGTTWNYANWAADGALEPRSGGFTKRGKSFIKDCDQLGILLDASHLSDTAFWDLASCSAKPFVATHSNVRALCEHPRNLSDDQIVELIRRDGRIGVTFVPWFVENGGQASIDGLLRHIEHICALGGERHLAFGSDFDGINQWIPGLENAKHYLAFAEQLHKRYGSPCADGFLYRNWQTFLERHLPVH